MRVWIKGYFWEVLVFREFHGISLESFDFLNYTLNLPNELHVIQPGPEGLKHCPQLIIHHLVSGGMFWQFDFS